ncbi:MAG: DUF4263 domain-containing protein [Candidatus Gracilibacteria bacterium]|nr:DUF4263 domain-containing protein [Candidatus Gracilibacteria bacterium]
MYFHGKPGCKGNFYFHKDVKPKSDLNHSTDLSYNFVGAETLLEFKRKNDVEIYISKETLEEGLENGYKIDGDKYYVDIKQYLEFQSSIKISKDGKQAEAFFKRKANILDIGKEEKEKIILNSDEESIMKWVKSLDKGKLDSFISKIGKLSNNSNLQIENKDIVDDFLKLVNIGNSIGIDKLNEISYGLNKNRIQLVIEEWEKNKTSKQETKFWQPFFKNNAWILGQLFGYSAILHKNEFYLGGQYQGDRKGAKFVDYAYKNGNSKNLAIIEIKEPTVKLMGGEYRGVYSMSEKLTGAINQVLNQKDLLLKDFRQNSEYNVFNPKCFLIIGDYELEKLNDLQKESFENFRNSNNSVEIITFNELLDKVKALLII